MAGTTPYPVLPTQDLLAGIPDECPGEPEDMDVFKDEDSSHASSRVPLPASARTGMMSS